MIQRILPRHLYLRYCYWRARLCYDMAHWRGTDEDWWHACWVGHYDWLLHACNVKESTP